MGPKKGLLSIVAPPPGELSDVFQSDRKEVIIKADLRALGFKGAKAKLTDLFADEEAKPLKITAKELKQGLSMNLSFPGGHVFLVEKRA